jgi:hypothetical protein
LGRIIENLKLHKNAELDFDLQIKFFHFSEKISKMIDISIYSSVAFKAKNKFKMSENSELSEMIFLKFYKTFENKIKCILKCHFVS